MWAEQVGDDSYTFENFYPYFMKSQNFTPPDQTRRIANATPNYDESALGKDGPLSVIFPNYAGAFGTWVEKGLAAVGIAPRKGFQNGELLGSSYALATINYDTNTRETSKTAFLEPEIDKAHPNVLIFPSTMAKQVLFDSNKKATGVRVDTSGLEYTLDAKQEVILSAGAFQSPQLLMVSGVGPAETLEKHGIEVLADRPGVGQNLTDHILFGTTHRVNVRTGSALAYGNATQVATSQFNAGHGPLTNPNVDMFGWEKLSTLNTTLPRAAARNLTTAFPPDWPEIEYIAPGGYFGFSHNYQTQPDLPTDGHNYATLVAGLVAPLSRGTVSIASPDAAAHPVIDPRWLSHPTDRALAVAAFRRVREIWATEDMARGLSIGGEYFPGEAAVPSADEGKVWEFVQRSFNTIFHASCTCRMGRREGDVNAVVDARARVIGVEGLRVVDASSMALLPPGHPMATIYALAEKIAEDILLGR